MASHTINFYELESDPNIKFDTRQEVDDYVKKNSILTRCVFRKEEKIIFNPDPADYKTIINGK